MSIIFTPQIGNIIYVSPKDNTNNEFKYVVKDVLDDGYLIHREGDSSETSKIVFNFRLQNWLVFDPIGKTSLQNFNVRINPIQNINTGQMLDNEGLSMDNAINHFVEGETREALSSLNETNMEHIFKPFFNKEYSIYERLFGGKSDVVRSLNILKQVQGIHYPTLISAITKENNIDALNWVASQTDVDAKDIVGFNLPISILDYLYEEIIPEDKIDIFKSILSIPGMLQALADKYTNEDQSMLISEFLENVPKEEGESKIRDYLESGPTMKSASKE